MRLFANRVERKRGKWAFLRWHDIYLDGKPYLTRFQILKTPWFSIKLHWIHVPDKDRALHDHPWAFAAVVLRGGYEEYESKDPANKPGVLKTIRWFNYKNTVTAHRIATVKPKTLTLVVTGPKVDKDWGFYDPETLEFTNWRNYEGAEG